MTRTIENDVSVDKVFHKQFDETTILIWQGTTYHFNDGCAAALWLAKETGLL